MRASLNPNFELMILMESEITTMKKSNDGRKKNDVRQFQNVQLTSIAKLNEVNLKKRNDGTERERERKN